MSCAECGAVYHVKRDRPERAQRHLCPACRSRVGAARAHRGFSTPGSDKAQRVRACGLVNKRKRLGWFSPPPACDLCRQRRPLDAHHPDYSKPDEVVFLCRSCHVRAHHNPALLSSLAVTKLDFRQDGKPVGYGSVHHRGGRKRQGGKAIATSQVGGAR